MMPYFDGLHRFLPALVRREGFEIAYVDVADRPRHSGVSNYGFLTGSGSGSWICWVWWLIRRKKPTPVCDRGHLVMTDMFNTLIRLSAWRLRHQIRRLGHSGICGARRFHHALPGAMDRIRASAQERDTGGVLVFLDRGRHVAADLRAVSPRSRLHRRPGAGSTWFIFAICSFIIVNGRQASDQEIEFRVCVPSVAAISCKKCNSRPAVGCSKSGPDAAIGARQPDPGRSNTMLHYDPNLEAARTHGRLVGEAHRHDLLADPFGRDGPEPACSRSAFPARALRSTAMVRLLHRRAVDCHAKPACWDWPAPSPRGR